MKALIVTAQGQITLSEDLLQHLGVQPGEAVTIDKVPGGALRIRAPRPSAKLADAFGALKRPGQRSLSIEEMNEIIAKGWAGKL